MYRISHQMYFCLLAPAVLVFFGVLNFQKLVEHKIVEHSYYYESQIAYFLQINAQLSQWPVFWKNVTMLGDALYYFPLLSFCIFLSPRIWAALFGAVPLSALLSVVLKHVALMPRPAAVLDHADFIIVGQVLAAHNSLPSGHTLTGFSITTVVVFTLMQQNSNRKNAFLILVGLMIAGTIAVSRVAIGAHWPMDIISGAVLGVAGGISGVYLADRFTGWWAWIGSEFGQFFCGIAMLNWGVLLMIETLSEISKHGESGLFIPWISTFCAIAVGGYLVIGFARMTIPVPNFVSNHAVNTNTN